MKTILPLFLAFLGIVPNWLHAQINGGPPVATQKCGIYFDYDAAGNRIKRYYDCKDITGGTGNQGGSPNARIVNGDPGHQAKQAGEVTVSPNPTAGRFRIQLSEDKRTHFHLYDNKGAIISSGFIEGQSYHGDITNLASGVYVLVVYYHDLPYTFRIVRR